MAFQQEKEDLARAFHLLAKKLIWFQEHAVNGVAAKDVFCHQLGVLARSRGQLGLDPGVAWQPVVGTEDAMTSRELEELSVLVYECMVKVAAAVQADDGTGAQ